MEGWVVCLALGRAWYLLCCRYFLNGSSEVGALLAELAGFGPQSRSHYQQTEEPPDVDDEPDESE